MKNKIKSIAVAVVLGVVGIFASLGLSGCGGSLSSLKSDYAAMEKKIASYENVFAEGTIDGISTKLKVNYGQYANDKIEIGDTNFKELEEKYNSILVISNDYVVQNIKVIENYGQKNLTKKAKKAVKELCDDIKDFTKYLKTFATSRKGFEDYFEQMGATASKVDIESQLVIFKKAYGKLISKNLAISNSVAKCMENTQIYESLKKTSADATTLKIIRDYARAKMLPVFSRLMLNETSNQFIWDNYKNKSDTLRQIDALLTLTETTYSGDYKTRFVSAPAPSNSDANVKALFEMVDEFLKEADSYLSALSDFDIREFAVGHDGNLKTYLKENKLAERDLYKMNQFLKYTLPNFMTNFSGALN